MFQNMLQVVFFKMIKNDVNWKQGNDKMLQKYFLWNETNTLF